MPTTIPIKLSESEYSRILKNSGREVPPPTTSITEQQNKDAEWDDFRRRIQRLENAESYPEPKSTRTYSRVNTESIRRTKMPKLTIPNQPGHYEGSGFEVNVFQNQIVIISTRERLEYDTSRHHAEPKKESKKEDDSNQSLLSSVMSLSERFGKKK